MTKVAINFNKVEERQSLDGMPTLDPFVIRDKSNGELTVAFKTSSTSGKNTTDLHWA